MIVKQRALPGWVIPLGCVLMILIAAWRVDTSSSIRSFWDWISRTEVVLGKDRFSKRQAMLARLGFLPVSQYYSCPERLGADTKHARRLFGGLCPEPAPERFDPLVPPSTSLLPNPAPALPEGAALVSLVCDAEDLFNEKYGIVPQAERRGRNWERPVWLTVTGEHDPLIEIPGGLRIHGGTSRTGDIKSFRVVFRRKYNGEGETPAGLFFGEETPPLESIVLMNASRPKRFVGALVMELATRAGCETSRLRPAVVYLNGSLIPTPYFLVEHQSRHFLRSRHGLRNFEFIRLKSKHERVSAAYKDFKSITMSERPLSLEEAARIYDLDDLCAWSFLISYLAVSDNNQGGYYRDRSNPDAPWHGLTWDLDGAFNGTFRGLDMTKDKEGRVDYLDILRGHRGRLFHKLMGQTPEFRRRFLRFALEKIRGPFSPEALAPLVKRYEMLARLHPAAYNKLEMEVNKVGPFLKEQPSRYLEYLERRWPEDFAAILAELEREQKP